MLDPELQVFFDGLKEKRLSKLITKSMKEEKVNEIKKEWDDYYCLRRWLPFASSNAEKRAMSSHPSKFSHPDVGASQTNIKKKSYVSPIIFEGKQECDGLFRTGNLSGIDLDSTGNGTEARSIGEVGALLSRRLSNGERFYQHLQKDSKQAKALLAMSDENYESLKMGLLSILKSGEQQTSSKIKQVYFPVDGDYHLLSILSNSGAMFKLSEKIANCRYGEDLTEKRKNKKKGVHGEDYKEIYDAAMIGFGGTQPNNISTINNTNAGKLNMLMSMPPSLSKRAVNFPNKDFFTQSISCQEKNCCITFHKLHRLYQRDQNNKDIRAYRDELYQDLVDYVIEQLWQIRSVKEQYFAENSQLQASQAIWLGVKESPEDDTWLDDIINQLTQFIFHGYETVLAKKAEKLGDAEYKHMTTLVDSNRELLR